MPEDVEVEDVSRRKSIGMPFQKRKQLEQDIQHISQEMRKRNADLAETNKTLSLLGTIDALVLQSHASLKTVTEHITEAIVQATDFAFVGLMTRLVHSQDELMLNGWSGREWLGKRDDLPNFGRPLVIDLSHPWFDVVDTSAIFSLSELSDEVLSKLLHVSTSEVRRIRKLIPVKSVYLMKLLARRQIVGLLIIGFEDDNAELKDTDQALLNRLSESIGVALDNKLLFEENKHVLRQLKD